MSTTHKKIHIINIDKGSAVASYTRMSGIACFLLVPRGRACAVRCVSGVMRASRASTHTEE